MAQEATVARKEALSETDEPSLESRVADNLLVICRSSMYSKSPVE